MKLYVKNMVCDRCKSAIKNELNKLAIGHEHINLGEILLSKNISSKVQNEFRLAIEPLGFQLIEDKSARLVNKIKSLIVTWVQQHDDTLKKTKFSVMLKESLHKDYGFLSTLFTSVEGTTIEQYLIRQKIERVKELLVYDEFSLKEIAEQLGYSSVQHLSSQFRKITGLTSSHFKKIGASKRTSIDLI